MCVWRHLTSQRVCIRCMYQMNHQSPSEAWSKLSACLSRMRKLCLREYRRQYSLSLATAARSDVDVCMLSALAALDCLFVRAVIKHGTHLFASRQEIQVSLQLPAALLP